MVSLNTVTIHPFPVNNNNNINNNNNNYKKNYKKNNNNMKDELMLSFSIYDVNEDEDGDQVCYYDNDDDDFDFMLTIYCRQQHQGWLIINRMIRSYFY